MGIIIVLLAPISSFVLYAFFGLRLLYIAWRSDSKASQKKEIEESFVLTFLAEWGDRSQIATIALATHKNAIGVAVGATLGHTICTSFAVVGGSMLASKISQGTVATIGAVSYTHHIIRCCGWQHAGVQDISGHSGCHWRPPLPWLLSVIILLPTVVMT
ncbi:hypothetical protein E2562_039218 [Oryza meyeriana var. granulata]|uniref:GDT1 family protein n=1 Tax=Oryza meyeriana var. granulata TaxID=110450 RepID=A0A6G1E8Q6_9ORYZ|nr:hypothetical protein E2562_039218 [Oryza meyeriana var. granulata]